MSINIQLSMNNRSAVEILYGGNGGSLLEDVRAHPVHIFISDILPQKDEIM